MKTKKFILSKEKGENKAKSKRGTTVLMLVICSIISLLFLTNFSSSIGLSNDNLPKLESQSIVTKIIAGSNISISPTSGTGVVTISSSGGGGAGGNPFDQVLNTTSDVKFDYLNVTRIIFPEFGGNLFQIYKLSSSEITMYLGGLRMWYSDGNTESIVHGSGITNTQYFYGQQNLEGAGTYAGTNRTTQIIKSRVGANSTNYYTPSGQLFLSIAYDGVRHYIDNDASAGIIYYALGTGNELAAWINSSGTQVTSVDGNANLRSLIAYFDDIYEQNTGEGVTIHNDLLKVTDETDTISITTGRIQTNDDNLYLRADNRIIIDSVPLSYNTWNDEGNTYNIMSVDGGSAILDINPNNNIDVSVQGTATVTDTYDDGTDTQIAFTDGLATAISTAYDISLMKNITYLSSINNTTNLVPVSFYWNNVGLKQFMNNKSREGLQTGYIAQDVQRIYPSCIIPEKLKQVVTTKNMTTNKTTTKQIQTNISVLTFNDKCRELLEEAKEKTAFIIAEYGEIPTPTLQAKSVVAQGFYTLSKVINNNTDYTTKFKNKTEYEDKTKNPSYVVIVNNKTGERLGTLDMENRIVNLEGYATDEMACLSKYNKFEDYRLCMLGGLPKK